MSYALMVVVLLGFLLGFLLALNRYRRPEDWWTHRGVLGWIVRGDVHYARRQTENARRIRQIAVAEMALTASVVLLLAGILVAKATT